jgi:hypothetical protein
VKWKECGRKRCWTNLRQYLGMSLEGPRITEKTSAGIVGALRLGFEPGISRIQVRNIYRLIQVARLRLLHEPIIADVTKKIPYFLGNLKTGTLFTSDVTGSFRAAPPYYIRKGWDIRRHILIFGHPELRNLTLRRFWMILICF